MYTLPRDGDCYQTTDGKNYFIFAIRDTSTTSQGQLVPAPLPRANLSHLRSNVPSNPLIHKPKMRSTLALRLHPPSRQFTGGTLRLEEI